MAYVEDITTIGAATNFEVSTITMVAAKTFYKIAASRKESSQESVPNENGGYTTTIKYFVAKQEASKSKILNSLNGTEALVAISIDQNGFKNILGAKDHPLMCRIRATKNPRNGYEIELIWEEHGDLPLGFTGTIPY